MGSTGVETAEFVKITRADTMDYGASQFRQPIHEDEGNMAGLCTTLHRHVEVISQYQSYSKFSTKDELHHEKVDCCGVAEKGYQRSCYGSGNINEESGEAFSYLFDLEPSMVRSKCCPTVLPVTHFPSPLISCVESVPQDAHVSHINVADSKQGRSNLCNEPSGSRVLHDVHISGRLMEDFLELARDNTKKDLETCGILGAFLTHPSQSCFMSSVDLHTHYSYQVMVPEAFAVVMAPTDTSKSFGIFRLSDPGGMNILKDCEEKGFHQHEGSADGSPIYDHCSNVYVNPNLRFEIFDLR
ncbi:AMSH-like ubiquitin thioesterase 2 isoform X5 [Malania oleifera]|uniref:AMSH-like ubiquitin thioesterase 2 isoform X5 n=1 Tax=Malania oleifera TaxID=397392 RepID=UPI0025ADFF5E|nr:AMSH-like ubiquitin thioesterase 2 isoform X5 [Malania oleifera]XP_057949928.1 AMSH-like ubiquitin thioesterase 2 isoform X5 [Malania oleifera]